MQLLTELRLGRPLAAGDKSDSEFFVSKDQRNEILALLGEWEKDLVSDIAELQKQVDEIRGSLNRALAAPASFAASVSDSNLDAEYRQIYQLESTLRQRLQGLLPRIRQMQSQLREGNLLVFSRPEMEQVLGKRLDGLTAALVGYGEASKARAQRREADWAPWHEVQEAWGIAVEHEINLAVVQALLFDSKLPRDARYERLRRTAIVGLSLLAGFMPATALLGPIVGITVGISGAGILKWSRGPLSELNARREREQAVIMQEGKDDYLRLLLEGVRAQGFPVEVPDPAVSVTPRMAREALLKMVKEKACSLALLSKPETSELAPEDSTP